MKRIFCFFSLLLFLNACTNDADRHPDVSNIALNVKIRRLDQELFRLQSKEAIKSFLSQNPLFAENFLQQSKQPNDSSLVNSLYRMVTDHHLDTLYRQTQAAFADLSDLEKSFAEAFKHIKYYYPRFRPPQVCTIVSGYGNDLFVSDSLIVVGLDFFLGSQGKYRPDVPNYMLKRYQRPYIVPSAMNLLSQSYNATDLADHTLLAEMIYYGKAYEFTKNMLPDTPDSLIIGYTGKQLTDSEDRQAVVWAHFVEKKLIYETNSKLKSKYTGERPFTAEISQEWCPGAIGRWLGWKIVREYRERQPEVTLPQLMKEKDNKAIFAQSKYKGR